MCPSQSTMPQIVFVHQCTTSLPIFLLSQHITMCYQRGIINGEILAFAISLSSTAAASFTSLLLPDAAGNPQLELLPVAAGEEEGHVPVDDEAVEAVPDLLVAVPDAPGDALPCQLPPVPAHLQAVAEVPGLAVLAHEPQERHVHWCHPQQECLKMQAEVLSKTLENRQHPCSVFHFIRVGLHITVVKGAAFMQVHLMVVYEMRDKHRNIASNQAF
jgi:hypothetical protein